MRRLVGLDLPAGPGFVAALRAVWDAGDAAFPIDGRLPPAARAAVIDVVAPGTIIDEGGEHSVAGGIPVEDGDALVIATSGTTGQSKAAVLTHDAVAASAVATSERIGVTDDDHWLACLPLAHVGGLSVVTRALALGTRLTVLPNADPAGLRAAATGGATLVSLVATALRRIEPEWFRVIVLGGSRPPADRPPNCIATYGMTETGSGVVYDGRPLAGVDVRVAPDGEVVLRGPMLLRAYRDGTDPKDDAGWFATGDLGRWLDDGRLHVTGRRADLIITGGENVWPETVEAALAGHPAVGDVAVVGLDDPEWGQVVAAFVVPVDPAAPPDLDGLRDHVKETLPAYCAPRRLVLVDAIPRTALGKVRRAELSDRPG